jgi:hypothetical protein
MRIMARSLLVVLLSGALGCGDAPKTSAVATALEAEYGTSVDVTNVARVNGVDYPASGGAPHRYEVEYEAVLKPRGPVTFLVAGGLGRSLHKGALIKGIHLGHVGDPQGMDVLLDVGNARWRTDETRPARVIGRAAFTKTEAGWRVSSLAAYLSEQSLSQGDLGAQQDAGIGATRDLSNATASAAPVSAMQADLRNVTAQQEIYYSNHGYRYSASVNDLQVRPSRGVVVRVISGDAEGWSAMAVHDDSNTICAVYIGRATPIPPADQPGVPACRDADAQPTNSGQSASSHSPGSAVPHTELLMEALRNLAKDQEIHYSIPASNYTYASSIADMERTEYTATNAAGVTITIVSANARGWSALASHRETNIVCAIFADAATPVPPAKQPGVPACSRQN